jgi:hypothetical protein
MRIGPLFIAALFYAWTFLAALGWAICELALRREPSLARLLVCLIVAALSIAFVIVATGGGVLSLLLTAPASFVVSATVCALAGHLPFGSSRRDHRVTMNPNRPQG